MLTARLSQPANPANDGGGVGANAAKATQAAKTAKTPRAATVHPTAIPHSTVPVKAQEIQGLGAPIIATTQDGARDNI